MQRDGVKPLSLKLDGGAAKNDLLMQTHADLLGIPCIRPETSDKTALGAAYLALLALKIFPSIDAVKAIKEKEKSFIPNKDRAWADNLIMHYHQILRCA